MSRRLGLKDYTFYYLSTVFCRHLYLILFYYYFDSNASQFVQKIIQNVSCITVNDFLSHPRPQAFPERSGQYAACGQWGRKTDGKQYLLYKHALNEMVRRYFLKVKVMSGTFRLCIRASCGETAARLRIDRARYLALYGALYRPVL